MRVTAAPSTVKPPSQNNQKIVKRDGHINAMPYCPNGLEHETKIGGIGPIVNIALNPGKHFQFP